MYILYTSYTTHTRIHIVQRLLLQRSGPAANTADHFSSLTCHHSNEFNPGRTEMTIPFAIGKILPGLMQMQGGKGACPGKRCHRWSGRRYEIYIEMSRVITFLLRLVEKGTCTYGISDIGDLGLFVNVDLQWLALLAVQYTC